MNLKFLKAIRLFHLIDKEKYNEKRQIEIVKASPLFDAKWYLEQNPDVRSRKIGAAKHYVKFGWKEGRNPSKYFETEAYLNKYPELNAKNWCPLFHYMQQHKELMPKINYREIIFNIMDKYTKKYKRKTFDYKIIAKSKYFNKRWYLKQNPDVKKSGIDPIEHYLQFGWKEGRNPSVKFDGTEYLERYSDIKKAKLNPLLHYERYGKKENRRTFIVRKIQFKKTFPNLYDKLICKYKMKNPKISIIVASYNYENFIKETLDSLMAQTYKNFEVIVVDDGSSDNSIKIIKTYTKKYSNIFLHRHHNGKNKGLPETIKLGIEKSIGEYIAFCESDDYWAENYLEEKVKIINSYACPKIIVNDVNIFGDKARCEVVKKMLQDRKSNFKTTKNKISIADFRLHNWIVTFSCCMVKASLLKKCDITSVPRKANLDWWLWRQLSCNNTIFYLNQKLTYWRIHESYMVKESISSIIKQKDFLKKGDAVLIKKYPLSAVFLFKMEMLNRKIFYTKDGSIYKDKNKIQKQPEFSVIMPTYNRGFCIKNAINSLLSQTYQNYELIIVDDGSTDNTKEIIKQTYAKELKTGRIKYIYKQNEGVCKARNVGLENASKEWIAYLDSDNLMVPEFLETFACKILERKTIKVLYARLIKMVSKREVGKAFNLNELKLENYIDLGVFVHHKNIYQELKGFDEQMTRLVDWELITKYTKKYYPLFIDRIVLIYNDSNEHDRITNNNNLQDNLNYFKQKHCDYPKITTMITTYNHEKYIAQAIESAIKQTGNFIHEILISDDGSTDKTPQIIAEYAQKYPHLIKNISSKQNIGISANMKKCFEAASGKYIAVLEGDDYWIDIKKLEKQMNFLEKNKDCSMVFSRVKVQKQQNFRLLERHNNLTNKLTGDDFIKELSLIVNFSCCMFIGKIMRSLPEVLYQTRFSEIPLAFYLEQKGKIGFINRPLSVYRQHENGVWTGADKEKQLLSGLKCRETAMKVCAGKYKSELQRIIDENYKYHFKN